MRQLFTDAPHKPKYRDPCNGCGICCYYAPCHLAAFFDPESVLEENARKPCRYLKWSGEDKRFFCGIIKDMEKEFGAGSDTVLTTKIMLAIDTGCTTTDTSVNKSGPEGLGTHPTERKLRVMMSVLGMVIRKDPDSPLVQPLQEEVTRLMGQMGPDDDDFSEDVSAYLNRIRANAPS